MKICRQLSFVIITFTIFFLNQTVKAEEYCHGSSPSGTSVLDDEYRIYNNVWQPDDPGAGEQCLEIFDDSTYFKVYLSTHNSSNVISYPFIWKGCHWGNCTSNGNPFPKKITDIKSAPFTWHVYTDTVSGTWNAAFEAWFDSTGSGSDYNAELMIWINYGGGASPAGNVVDNVNIGGHSWQLKFAPWESWNYIAYRINTVTDSISVDFRDFIHDSVKRGYLDSTWYLHNMETGFEIWRNGQGLTTHSFKASIEEGKYIPPSSVVINEHPRITDFHLKQNYPNPFNPYTNINFNIEKSSLIDLSVYDILGRKVQTLKKGFYTPGQYNAIFNASLLSSGVYYYQLEISGEIQRKKCIYIK